jgi:hypothetical protein
MYFFTKYGLFDGFFIIMVSIFSPLMSFITILLPFLIIFLTLSFWKNWIFAKWLKEHAFVFLIILTTINIFIICIIWSIFNLGFDLYFEKFFNGNNINLAKYIYYKNL